MSTTNTINEEAVLTYNHEFTRNEIHSLLSTTTDFFTFTRDVEEKLAKEQKSTGGPKLWHTILLAQHQAAQRRVSDLQTTMKTLSHKHEKNLAAATSRRMTLKRHKKPTKMLHEL